MFFGCPVRGEKNGIKSIYRGCEKSLPKKKDASKQKYLEAFFFFGIIFV